MYQQKMIFQLRESNGQDVCTGQATTPVQKLLPNGNQKQIEQENYQMQDGYLDEVEANCW